MQLAQWQPEFAAMGVAVAGMTYDSLEVLSGFHAEHALNFPLLRDEDVRHVNAFGVRNPDYEPGHAGYGIPLPGIFYIGADGVIRAKFAVPGYRRRPPFDEVEARIADLLAADATE